MAVYAEETGYLSAIDIASLTRTLALEPGTRLSFVCHIGDFVPLGGVLANLQGAHLENLRAAVLAAITIGDQRDIVTDPANSLDHIATIGWTAISTAHSDPAVGAIAISALQRLLHAWSEPVQRLDGKAAQVCYNDPLPEQLIDTFETFVVASNESRQHQALALLLRTVATSLPALRAQQQERFSTLAGTIVASLKEHPPTRVLHQAATSLVQAYTAIGMAEAARILSESVDASR